MGKKYDELKARYTWKFFENPPHENGFYAVRSGVLKTGCYYYGKWYAVGGGFTDDSIIHPSEWCYLPMERE
jgi:hypothetical protein